MGRDIPFYLFIIIIIIYFLLELICWSWKRRVRLGERDKLQLKRTKNVGENP